MTTEKTDTQPLIEWERGELVENFDGYKEYNAFGTSLDGREWIARWMEMGGEFQELIDPEEA